jgi:hypothetical protein
MNSFKDIAKLRLQLSNHWKAGFPLEDDGINTVRSSDDAKSWKEKELEWAETVAKHEVLLVRGGCWCRGGPMSAFGGKADTKHGMSKSPLIAISGS